MSPRTLLHAPPAGQSLTGFGTGTAYDNATTARSRRLVALSQRAEVEASRCAVALDDAPTAPGTAALRARRDHHRRRSHALWRAALAADPVLAGRYR